MTTARPVLPLQAPRVWRDAVRPAGTRRPAARARAALALAAGSLAGAALGVCCGIHAPTVEATSADARSLPAAGDGPAAGAPQQARASVAAVLAPAVVADIGTSSPSEDAQP